MQLARTTRRDLDSRAYIKGSVAQQPAAVDGLLAPRPTRSRVTMSCASGSPSRGPHLSSNGWAALTPEKRALITS